MTFRTGVVCVIGRPNVGKSTLVNQLVGEKVSIITPKPQTTRHRIRGIVNTEQAQLVLVDTPGLCAPGSALHKAMRRLTTQSMHDVDANLVVVTAQQTLHPADAEVLQMAKAPLIVAVNKIDRLGRKEEVLPLLQYLGETYNPVAIVPICALRGDGVDVLRQELLARLPPGEPLFPADLYTDQAERVLCAEIVREKALYRLQQEVPHCLAVVIETFEDDRREDGGLCRLEGVIVVERESQRGIVVGKGGAAIKQISQAARYDIEALLGCQVYLRLRVLVKQDWTHKPHTVREYGIAAE